MRLRSRKQSVVISLARRLTHRTIRGRSATHRVGDFVVMRLLFIVLLTVLSTHFSAAIVEDVSPQRGRPVAQIKWIDDAGQIRQLSEFAGFPVVLLPLYNRCRPDCIATPHQPQPPLPDSPAHPPPFRVLLFSLHR